MIDELKQYEYDKGYQQGKANMLQKIGDIKAEIRKYENDCMMSCVNNDDCRNCNDNTFESIYKIIDKHIESEEV